MKTKQEQIEEMSCILTMLINCGGGCMAQYCHLVDNYAKKLIEAGYGDVSEYKAEREMLGSQIKVLKQRLNDKYIEVDNLNRRYTNAFERLKAQEREIEKLEEENYTNMQYIRMMGIQSHIKTSNERVKQAQIDVLNKLKSSAVYDDNYLDGYVFIDDVNKLIEEVKDAKDKS